MSMQSQGFYIPDIRMDAHKRLPLALYPWSINFVKCRWTPALFKLIKPAGGFDIL